MPVAVSLTGSLSLGELIVGAGTLALAAFTWRLAHVTVSLDRAREARETRGIARLVAGELALVERSIHEALDLQEWRVYLSTSHGAWDDRGWVISAVLPYEDAVDVIQGIAELHRWEEVLAKANRGPEEWTLSEPDIAFLNHLDAKLRAARQCLLALAESQQ
jgi:hypothetical protein